MKKDTKEVFIAVGIVLVDFVTVGIPLAALVLAYVILAKPKWFKEMVDEVYKTGE